MYCCFWLETSKVLSFAPLSFGSKLCIGVSRYLVDLEVALGWVIERLTATPKTEGKLSL